ncbi:hypothetical protein ElyMa_001530200 [Elysia marginata]|uniref:Uncharacterized protein n=1 Tax=Elysia marginata TaxID=1093978 RepID=A0AAV4J7X2_9GAST|nr:hypothetical protein ElyMa_001530200 [Elysia marginata]
MDGIPLFSRSNTSNTFITRIFLAPLRRQDKRDKNYTRPKYITSHLAVPDKQQATRERRQRSSPSSQGSPGLAILT